MTNLTPSQQMVKDFVDSKEERIGVSFAISTMKKAVSHFNLSDTIKVMGVRDKTFLVNTVIVSQRVGIT